jgi:hypothetical protein
MPSQHFASLLNSAYYGKAGGVGDPPYWEVGILIGEVANHVHHCRDAASQELQGHGDRSTRCNTKSG